MNLADWVFRERRLLLADLLHWDRVVAEGSYERYLAVNAWVEVDNLEMARALLSTSGPVVLPPAQRPASMIWRLLPGRDPTTYVYRVGTCEGCTACVPVLSCGWRCDGHGNLPPSIPENPEWCRA